MEFDTLLFDVSDHVAQITLNRPNAANTVNLQLAEDLARAALLCDEDPEIRAVLLTASGKVFCGGGDLREFYASGDELPRHLKELTGWLHLAVSRLARMDPPVVVAVQGAAGGAGLSLVCACDFVVAADTARFTMAYTQVGLTPDGSSTYSLPRIVGLRRALELTLTGRVLSAAEALDWGIVTRVVPAAELSSAAAALARELAAGPTLALGAAKRLLQSGASRTLETQMEFESRAIADAARSADAREGVRAFLAKQTPTFRGA